MKKIDLGCKALSLLILLTTILNWQSVVAPLQMVVYQDNMSFQWTMFLVSISLLFVILNLSAAAGLFFLKKWGFKLSYIAIIFSTVFFSTNYLPLVTYSIKHSIGGIFTFIPNILVLSALVYFDRSFRMRAIK